MQGSNSIKFTKFIQSEHIKMSCAKDTIRGLLLSGRDDKMLSPQIKYLIFLQQQSDAYTAHVGSLVAEGAVYSSLSASTLSSDDEEDISQGICRGLTFDSLPKRTMHDGGSTSRYKIREMDPHPSLFENTCKLLREEFEFLAHLPN